MSTKTKVIKKRLPIETEKQLADHCSEWGRIMDVIPGREFRHNESLCDTVVRLLNERNKYVADMLCKMRELEH